MAGPFAGIRFGAGENQIQHTFRHADRRGLDRYAIMEAICNDILQVAEDAPIGHIKGAVVVAGVKLKYSAYRLPDGVINVGRITPEPQ
jgi:hypothetical protein